MVPFEVIEHTADIGLRIYGRSLNELFCHAGQGLFYLITDVDKTASQTGPERISFHLKGKDEGDLLLAWLRELLYTFSAKGLVLTDFRFEALSGRELKASALGNPFDPDCDEQKYEVKAVTYHQFKIERTKKGWLAEVIFDI